MGALVFGGTGGIGSAVVDLLVERDRDVVCTYLRAADSAERLVQRHGGRVKALPVDIRDEDAVAAAVAMAGPDLDLVVYAAASGVFTSLQDSRARQWRWTMETNAGGLLSAFRASVEVLSRQLGSIVALTSLGARAALPGYGLVGPAKAALESVVRYAAVEGAPMGVRVNAVCPGLVETKALTSFAEGAAALDQVRRDTPAGRLATPQDVAGAVLWLGEPESSMVTGQVLVVDGGWELVRPSHPVGPSPT